VKHEQKWIECGGGFIKLLPTGTKQQKFDDKSRAMYAFSFVQFV
jgi:hypothetical protein